MSETKNKSKKSKKRMVKTKHPGIYYWPCKDGSRSYHLRITVDGMQTWTSAGPSLSNAQDLWRRHKIGLTDDKFGIVRPRKKTFKSIATDYFEKHYKTISKERNWPRVESIIKMLNNYFGNMHLHKISSWTISNYINRRKREGVRSGSVNLELDYLRAILNKAVEWGYLKSIPKFKRLPVAERRARDLSESEIEYILERISGDHKDALQIAAGTGCRLGELFRLRQANVDFKAGLIHLDDTKNLKPRSIPMTNVVRGIIQRRFQEHDGRIFKQKHLATVASKFAYERKKLTPDIEPWRFHDLRHTFVTRLIQKNIDPYTVMELAGHSRLEMVTRYSHTNDEIKKTAIAKLEIELE